MTSQVSLANLEIEGQSILMLGDWTFDGISKLCQQFNFTWPPDKAVDINGSQLSSMDTAGAWLMYKIVHLLEMAGKSITFSEFPAKYLELFRIAAVQADKVLQPVNKPGNPNIFYRVGCETFEKIRQVRGFLRMVGELSLNFARALMQPGRFQFPSIIGVIERTGYDALPIIGLLSFLVGVVLAYQFGLELESYGANIYIVNAVGIAILREFGPLVTAIILAGRTSSSFTAQLGMMKVNEEIDALLTMGLSPNERLILPKVMGLLVVMPLLIVWANLFGILGSMVMAKGMLSIGYYDFLQRFQEVIAFRHYFVGLVKAPAFALIIASVGCYQGFRVSLSADSVGMQTTKSVVQAIFLIIIVDAIFSVVFSGMGL